MSNAIATVYTNVRGKYHNDCAVNVVTKGNDADDSHGKVWRALSAIGYVRKHKEPRGHFHLSYDPDEIGEAYALRMVIGALRDAEILVFRKLPDGQVVDA